MAVEEGYTTDGGGGINSTAEQIRQRRKKREEELRAQQPQGARQAPAWVRGRPIAPAMQTSLPTWANRWMQGQPRPAIPQLAQAPSWVTSLQRAFAPLMQPQQVINPPAAPVLPGTRPTTPAQVTLNPNRQMYGIGAPYDNPYYWTNMLPPPQAPTTGGGGGGYYFGRRRRGGNYTPPPQYPQRPTYQPTPRGPGQANWEIG